MTTSMSGNESNSVLSFAVNLKTKRVQKLKKIFKKRLKRQRHHHHPKEAKLIRKMPKLKDRQPSRPPTKYQ